MKRVPKLLVVDDDAGIRDVFSGLAESIGFEPYDTDDGDGFGDLILKIDPDVLILDLKMPGRDGVELLRTLSELDSKVRVVLCSGMDERTLNSVESMGAAKNVDVAAKLTKPVRPERFVEVLEPMFQAAADKLASVSATNATGKPTNHVGFSNLYRSYARLQGDTTSVDHRFYVEPTWVLDDGSVLEGDSLLKWSAENGMNRGILKATFAGMAADATLELMSATNVLFDVKVNPELLQDLKFADELSAIARFHQIPSSQIYIQVEEHVLRESFEVIDVLTRLRISGFKVALIGSSCGDDLLIELSHWPVDCVLQAYGGCLPNDVEAMDSEREFELVSFVSVIRKKQISCVATETNSEAQLLFARDCGFDWVHGSLFSEDYDAAGLRASLTSA